MKRLTCEMCGSYDLVKQDGVFVCQHCGCKYSLDEAKKMMGMGTSEGGGSTVKIHTSDELATLFQLARKAKADNNSEEAAQYYKKIVEIETTIHQGCFSWEAWFYDAYFSLLNSTSYEPKKLHSRLKCVFDLIAKNPLQKYILDNAEQRKAVEEVAKRIIFLSSKLFNKALNYWDSNEHCDERCKPAWFMERVTACTDLLFTVGSYTTSLFGNKYASIAVECWKLGIEMETTMYSLAGNKLPKDWDEARSKHMGEDNNSATCYYRITQYINEIKKYDSYYSGPTKPLPPRPGTGGCYVATAVYGSYDCPQVWTLRRYRDYTLAETWYGRAFIRTYYAISPTLVKWFGHTDWFKNMWKGTLDRMVADLNASGVEDSPYEDKVW